MILVYMEGKFIDLSDLVHLKLDSVNVSWCSVIQYQYIFGSKRSLRSANVVGHVSVPIMLYSSCEGSLRVPKSS